MACLWVTNLELAGRRVRGAVLLGPATVGVGLGLALGVGLGLGLVTGTATAATAPVVARYAPVVEAIGISPAADVVAKAPQAVSVTFNAPLRPAGATLLVLSEAGDDVGQGEVTTRSNTLRRTVRIGAPGGDYTIVWRAVAADGQALSGTFEFTAARGNGEPPSGPAFTPPPHPAAVPAVPSVPSEPAAWPSPVVLAQPGFTFQPAPAGSAGRPAADRVSGGFIVVPLIVGGLLVVAAGLIAKFNRPRLPVSRSDRLRI
jgi:methionine-rich copper-binding protein CopC